MGELLEGAGTTMMGEFKHQSEISVDRDEEDIIEEAATKAVAANREEEEQTLSIAVTQP
ncbi:hypothetical protein HOY80DRAFT_1052457 [Tuber brumale]|nr:hypothetical protein HOY80DRAFT_1052457 [Tuber brumale]